MTDYILAAEADKIQDLIFRSAHLREVVGGSQLLTDFCREMPEALGMDDDDIVISDGGSFTLLFRSEDNAKTFGEKLAEAYRRATGGSLTVAEPEAVNGDFGAASEKAQAKLRAAKQDRKNAKVTTAHLPYEAFCVSCGIGLAENHQKLHLNDNQAQYFCASCLGKSAEWKEERLGSFLGEFYKLLGLPPQNKYVPVAEDVAKLDPRDYVAYLLADGNSMGAVFGECSDHAQLEGLSDKLTEVTRSSLAAPTKLLITRPEVREKMGGQIGVLPLILGGDDLFALLPAPWALDFARRFAREYEKRLGKVFDELKIKAKPPTLGVAVVICKAKYPYYLAHDRGHELLEQAKRLGKGWAQSSGKTPRSTVNFEVILGNRLAEEGAAGEYRPTLRPYWTGDDNVDGWGLSIRHLLAQRLKLKNLPHRRLAQLRAIFDEMSHQDHEQREKTLQRLEKLIRRIAHISDYDDTAAHALEALGGRATLYKVRRATDKSHWEGHAMPDLLDAWDFAYDLAKSSSDYEGGR